jgi:hypothetical protein
MKQNGKQVHGAVTRPITARQRAEAALVQQVQELARQALAGEALPPIASHDLQELLRQIMLLGNRLRLRSITAEFMRIRALVHGLLACSGADQAAMQRRLAALDTCAQNALRSLRRRQ